MIFWGLVETELQEAIDLFVLRSDAEAALASVLADEPDWNGLVRMEPIELVGFGLN